MRLHALHVQGLRAPPGSGTVRIDGGYTLGVGPEPSLVGVRDLLLSLLCPEQAIEELSRLRDPSAGRPARAVLTFRAAASVYRIAADLDRERVVLARHDPEAQGFVRIAAGATEVETGLLELGRPDSEGVRRLSLLCCPTERSNSRRGEGPLPGAAVEQPGARAPPELPRQESAPDESRKRYAPF